MKILHRKGKLLWVSNAMSMRETLRTALQGGADLRGADLSDEDLSGADLRYANLSCADLSGADLRYADLSNADLRYADLGNANLSDANLSGVNLRGAHGADLSGADLAKIQKDFLAVLRTVPSEAEGLLRALKEGRVNGTQYKGECACLIGTVANLRKEFYEELSVNLRPDGGRPAERWFLAIKTGDTPETNQVSAITVKWLEAFLAEVSAPAARDASVG